MRIIDFNQNNFKGFENEEKILIDTGVIYAYYNEYDAYHQTVKNLFDTYVFGNEDVIFLFVNPTIINEIVNLAQKPITQYLKAFPHESDNFTQQDEITIRNKIMNKVKNLVQDEVLIVIEGDKDSVLKQIDITNILGAADAVNVSLANLYGISFMTVDRKLVNNIESIKSEIDKIQNIYFTIPKHRTYFT